MHFSTNITRIASTPPWANVTHFDGVEGFFVDTNAGDKVFLRKSDHVIWLPKSLRGRKVESLHPDELKMLPKEDSGKAHYESWRVKNDSELALSKLHNGYAFQPQGQALLERMTKLIDKYELDNTANIGLDPKFSINPDIFQKLIQSNNRDDVKRWGKVIAKKFAMIIHMLAQVNPKMAKRLDSDFMFAYKKLMPLFDFDPTKFQPNLPQPQQQEEESITIAHILVMHATAALKEIRPLMSQDLVFFPVMQGFVRLLGALKKFDFNAMNDYRKMFNDLINQMVDISAQSPSDDPFASDPAQIAQQVMASPALIELHHIFNMPSDPQPVAEQPQQ